MSIVAHFDNLHELSQGEHSLEEVMRLAHVPVHGDPGFSKLMYRGKPVVVSGPSTHATLNLKKDNKGFDMRFKANRDFFKACSDFADEIRDARRDHVEGDDVQV